MKTQLGDTVEFNDSGKGIHDKKPTIFFLAKVGGLVHGLNQHYQSPQEKVYYYMTLKSLLYDKIKTGKLTPQAFYKSYIKGRLITNSYRTYDLTKMSSMKVIPVGLFNMTRGVDKRLIPKMPTFKKGEKVRYIKMVRGKLSWVKGVILGRKVPGANYVVRTTDNQIVYRHPYDLKKIP